MMAARSELPFGGCKDYCLKATAPPLNPSGLAETRHLPGYKTEWGGRRRLFAVPRGESEPPPPPGGK